MNRLTLNGQDVTAWTAGLDDMRILFLLNEANRTVSYSAAGTVIMKGPAYTKALELIQDLSKSYIAVFTSDTVGSIEYEINARNVKDCGCEAEVVLQTNTNERVAYEKLARSIISDEDAIIHLHALGQVGKVGYCNEPNFITYVILVYYLVLRIVIDLLILILSFFDSDINYDRFGNWVLGCARYHFAWNVNGTIDWWANKAGLVWSSTVLQAQNRFLYFLDAYGYEGLLRWKTTQGVQDTKYIVNLTVPQFLDQLREVFNADYRIINGVLYFERVDWFPANAFLLKGQILESYCVEHDPKRMATNYRYNWAADPMDETSSLVANKYGGREDMNPGEFNTLRGTRTRSPRFALTRFSFDRDGDAFIRRYRLSPFVGSSLSTEIILSNGQTSEIRLIELPAKNGQYLAPSYIANQNEVISQPGLSFEGLDFGNTKTAGHLWERYHSIEDPIKFPRYFASEITFKPDDTCEAITQIQNRSMNVYVQTPYGRAVPEEIEYDQNGSIFTLRNCTIWP